MKLLLVLIAAVVQPDPNAAEVQGEALTPSGHQEAADNRPVLWRGLRAGMSALETQATLRKAGIRARLLTDEETGRHYVEAPGQVQLEGRPALMAFGFVADGLFWIDVNAHRSLSRPVSFATSHFARVARMLEQEYGPPVSIDTAPIVTARSQAGFAATATARFERGGVRAEVDGVSSYSVTGGVEEVVNVRFWRVIDAEAYAASEERAKAVEPEA